MNLLIEGLWHLRSMEQRYDDGRVVYPLGKDARGRIYYGADGTMFVAAQKGERRPFTSGKQWTASSNEKALAYDEYLTYCGRYEIAGDQVTHFIEISLFPNWIGTRQVRTIKLESDLLYITARLESETPEARTSFLIWNRASASSVPPKVNA
jgi:hypothetical protein